MAVGGARARVPWASDPVRTRGRLFAEPDDARNPFRRDCDRIIHSTAFRRLKHKTQVFVFHEGDHFRTRLTHTLEVAQVARSIARALGLDEDLAEALALAHDLGHPPFAHAGERALNACLAGRGGFDHNAQSLRVVTRLESRYAAFDGLNLTWETLEGIVKHNGPLTDAAGHGIGRYAAGLPHAVQVHSAAQDLELHQHAGPEAQVAAIADDIAYDVHDLDDGLRAGFFTLEEIEDLPLIREAVADVRSRYPELERHRVGAETMRRVITRFIEDVVRESDTRAAGLESAAQVRALGRPLIGFSDDMRAKESAIKDFLFTHMYRHARVERVMREAMDVVRDLYGHFTAYPEHLPAGWTQGLDPQDTVRLSRRVADYIAGMTDRYALDQHARFFDLTPELR